MPITQAEIDLALALGQEVIQLLSGQSTSAETQQRIADGIAQGNAWITAHGGTPVAPADGESEA